MLVSGVQKKMFNYVENKNEPAPMFISTSGDFSINHSLLFARVILEIKMYYFTFIYWWKISI